MQSVRHYESVFLSQDKNGQSEKLKYNDGLLYGFLFFEMIERLLANYNVRNKVWALKCVIMN